MPKALVRALSRRSFDATLVADEPAVMVALARGETRVVIVIEPQRVNRLSELTRAVATYYPQVARWQLIEDEVGPRLCELAPVGQSTAPPQAQTTAGAPSEGGSSSEHFGAEHPAAENDAAQPTATGEPPAASVEPATVTEAELAMLLSDPPATSAFQGEKGEQR
jgi:hypothetical protein